MIQVNRLQDEAMLVCTFEGNWTQETYRQTLRHMEALGQLEPLDVIVDMRASRIPPNNLMELMREGVDQARRLNVAVAIVSESSVFARLYQVVNAAYYGGLDASFNFVETMEAARTILRQKQAARQSV